MSTSTTTPTPTSTTAPRHHGPLLAAELEVLRRIVERAPEPLPLWPELTRGCWVPSMPASAITSMRSAFALAAEALAFLAVTLDDGNYYAALQRCEIDAEARRGDDDALYSRLGTIVAVASNYVSPEVHAFSRGLVGLAARGWVEACDDGAAVRLTAIGRAEMPNVVGTAAH